MRSVSVIFVCAFSVHWGEAVAVGEDQPGPGLWEPNGPGGLHQTLDREDPQADWDLAAAQPKYDTVAGPVPRCNLL